MGADLMLNYVELKENKEQALERLAKMKLTEEDLERFDTCGVYDFGWDDDGFTDETIKSMRKRLAQAVEVVYDCEGSREVNTLTIDGDRTFVITGGMSWGDEPSSLYTDFYLFSEFLAYPSWEKPDSEEARKWANNA